MREIVCRFHVIVKYFGRNKKAEMFFPLMFITFWANIVAQCCFYLSYRYFFESSLQIDFSNENNKIVLIAVAFLTGVALFFTINDEVQYEKAEVWYSSKTTDQQFNISAAIMLPVFILFFTVLVWALYIM